MRTIMGAIICVIAAISVAYAAGASAAWQTLEAKYTIFSGPTLADREAATANDRKLAIVIEGKPAKDIFNAIGPDSRDTCSAQQGGRDRRKAGIYCTYAAKNEGRTNAYRCWMGTDLVSGEAGAFVSC